MEEALRSRLLEILGPDGIAGGDAVTPKTVTQVAEVCRLCTQTSTPMTVISDRRASESAVSGVLLSLARLNEVRIDPAAQMAHAQAGATVTAVRAAAKRKRLALVAVGGGVEHVGSAVASGSLPRRALVGVELMLSSGELLHIGGRVLKDVTGYDITGLVLGSMGRLALIVGASFRLVPLGASLPQFDAAGASGPMMAADLLAGVFDPDRLLRPVG